MTISYHIFRGVTKILPLVAAAGLLLATGCTNTPTQNNSFDGLKVTEGDGKKSPEFGEGLNGRLVDGKRVYTVMMMLSVSKEGRVTDVEMIRTDAPQRLQWAAMQAMRKNRYGPQPQAWEGVQVIYFNGFKVLPG